MAENASTPETTGKDPVPPSKGGKMKLWIIVYAAAVVVCSGAGFGVAKIMEPKGPDSAKPAQEAKTPEGEQLEYIAMEPVIVNLNEPKFGRYIRADLKLAVKPEDAKVVEELVKKRKPELKNMLNIYLANLSLDDVRGEKNRNRILRENRSRSTRTYGPAANP